MVYRLGRPWWGNAPCYDSKEIVQVWDFSAIILSCFILFWFSLSRHGLFTYYMESVLLLPSWTIFIIRSYSVRINSSLFFVCIPEELRLSLYRNVSKHTEISSVSIFFYRRESANFRKRQGKLMFNDSSNFETYRQEKKVNRCKLYEYENCEEKNLSKLRVMFCFSICLLFSFCSFAFLVLEVPPPPFL